MKRLLILAFILLSCEVIDEPIRPIHCYYSEIQVSATTGKVISINISSDFLYNREGIDKCKCNTESGPAYSKDDSSHIVTINSTYWIYPDSKGN